VFRIVPLVCAALACAQPLVAADSPPPIGTRIADFTLTDAVTGKPWSLSQNTRDAKATVVLFTATGCPVNNAYLPRLAELSKRFGKDGVVFVAVNSHPNDDAAAVAAHVKENAIPYPVLKDDGTALADKFAVARVPTAYVLDAGRNVRYKGRIDDQFAPGRHGAKATTRDLSTAINAVVDGKEVAVPFVEPAGCKLTREKKPAAADTAVTYHKDVARIIQAKCQMCHRPGEPTPFSLLTYKHAKGWADMIREVVADGVMPPWHATAPHGHFLNDRRLSDEQKKTLLAWIDQGCPEGDPKDGPEPVSYAKGWRLGREPDVVVKMNEKIDVPAQYVFGLSGMPYQYIPAGEPMKEDTWVQAVEVRPGLRAALHHIIVFVLPPGKRLHEAAAEQNFGKLMLAAYVPGDDPVIFPEGTAKFLPKGSRLVFEMHYTPNGKAGTDQSYVGLILAKKPPKRVTTTDAILNERFTIPPGAAAHQVKASRRFDEEVTLTAMTPHMHVRGKAFKYELIDGETQKTETLLDVPRYDFNWQVAYALAKPRRIPVGSILICTAWYDNSDKNPMNPDPTKRVRWGQQTWEEMMIGFVEYEYDRK
jgi:thiol-disulfide isomerase/thioredoxin